MAIADLYENDNWARKGCVWPGSACMYTFVGSWREEMKISL